MHHAVNKYQLKLDIQHFLWPVYYISYITSKVTTPQDARKRLVLQVYLGLNALEFSAISIGKIFVRKKQSSLLGFRDQDLFI